tara:strand:- start:293 stop:592 length:300 start_codon:yes stop_codon:yes gene_type:complete
MNKPFKFPLDDQKELFPELVEDKSVYMYGNFEDTLGHFTPKPPSDYEFDNFMSQPEEGLVSEVHSKIYKQKNGNTKIVTVKRKFYGDNDYQDSHHSEIL